MKCLWCQEPLAQDEADFCTVCLDFAHGTDIADQLAELHEPRGFQPIGLIVEKILHRVGASC